MVLLTDSNSRIVHFRGSVVCFRSSVRSRVVVSFDFDVPRTVSFRCFAQLFPRESFSANPVSVVHSTLLILSSRSRRCSRDCSNSAQKSFCFSYLVSELDFFPLTFWINSCCLFTPLSTQHFPFIVGILYNNVLRCCRSIIQFNCEFSFNSILD